MARAARVLIVALVVAVAAGGAGPLDAQTRPKGVEASAEAATARRFDALRKDPALLRAFLREMPKGGDVHNHLSGAIYAESYLRWAAADGLCLSTATMALVQPPCEATARPAASAVVANSALYNQTIDAWSMRWWPAGRNGHDHFFAAFGLFGLEASKTGDMLAEVAARAAAEHVSYLELMLTPDGGAASQLGRATGWDADFGRLRDRLLAAGFAAVVSTARQRLDAAEAREREVLGCGTPEPDPGCDVTIRYISQVSRASAREQVFAQMLAGFELTSADPRVVGLNLVQPEDAPTALGDFHLQMSMLDFLHKQYPRVKIALHAGELTDGLVPPEDLRDHVRQSIDLGHASRIGHGVDVMSEDQPFALLREMAARRVLVEIALSSNDLILGVSGPRHPLATYRRFGVPVSLVSDDAGVSRSSLTLEFLKGVEEQGLGYAALKEMARNSIAYAFVDVATKAKLLGALDRSFDAFERREQALAVPGPGAVIDSHCHLADEAFTDDLDAVVTRAREAGVARALVILAAGDEREAAQARRVEALWPDVRVSIGVHPHQAHAFADGPARAADCVRAQAASTPGARAIGEIGLDYHYDFSPRDVQQAVFAAQVRLARELDLPVVIHTREADADTIAILKEEGQGRLRGVLHCFTGDASLAAAGLELGFYISLAGIITFPKAGTLRDTVRGVPLDRLLTETDSPYLAPVPHRGKRNEPAWVVRVAEALAALHGVAVDRLAAAAEANFTALFRP